MGLRDVYLGLIGKRVVDFVKVRFSVNRTFSLGRTAVALRAKIDRKSAVSLQRGHFEPISGRRGRPSSIIFARIVRPMNTLQLGR